MDHPTRPLNNPADPRATTPCPKCQGPRLWAETVTKDAWGRYSTVHLSRTKGIKFLTGPDKVYTLCCSLVCTTCGYTELYAQEPGNLLPP